MLPELSYKEAEDKSMPRCKWELDKLFMEDLQGQ